MESVIFGHIDGSIEIERFLNFVYIRMENNSEEVIIHNMEEAEHLANLILRLAKDTFK